MSINFNEKNIFFTPLYEGELSNIDNEQLMNEIYSIREQDPTGRIISNRNGWQSDDIYYEYLKENNFVEFEKLLLETETIVNNISKLWGIFRSDEIKLDNAWCNINGFGGSNSPHTHANCIFSFVYYVKANENSSKIVFMRPDLQEHYTVGKVAFENVENQYILSRYEHSPYEGNFLVFPSWIQHYVEPNMDEEERISIAINFSSN